MEEKFIVRVIRHRLLDPNPESTSQAKREQIDQVFEQEFKKLDIGEFVMALNKKDGQEKDKESIKV